DVAPAHRCREITKFLAKTFEGKVISQCHSIEWPLLSPVRTPPDFFL
ncbi:hypothetical protein B4U79_12420, partial [Dinothrombium tinctorium]